MANDNMNVVDRIRSGWGRFFSRENGRATETKYIPQSRFFSPSELEELEKKDELNPMEKRALEYGKIAAKQSNRSNIEYVPVLFDGTTLIAWVDGEESPLADFRAKMMNDELKREGYQLSKELEQSILEEQGKTLVDKLFIRKGEEYIKVDSYSGDNEPSLSFTSYNIETMESVNIPYDVRLFQEMLGREEMKEAETYNVLDFDKKLQTLRESQNLLQDTVKFIEESKIYKGKLDISEGHEYSSLGDYSSHSWSYGAGNIEFYGYFEDDGDAIQTKVINTKSAYHYRELLREVSDAVQREKVLNDVNTMRQALGKEPIQGEHQITYLTTQKDNLLKELIEAMDATSLAAQGPSNTELEHRQDEAAFLKLNKALNAVAGSYDKSEKMLEDYEKSNGIHDNDISNMARRMNSVSKYIDTLKDTRIPMSGDFQEHLPNNHHLRELYSKFESSEEELYGYSRSVGTEEGEYERLKVNYKNASDAFNKELTDILDYYENLMNLNGETIHENVQGLEYYGKRSLKNHILDEITEKFVIGFEGDEITRVNDLEIHGSRGRGTARPDSDLDVVVEYEGSLREDDAFNFLNEDPLIYNGIKVDVNPIRKQETGTLQDYMVKSRKYDQQILKQLGEDNANKAEAEKKIRFSRVSTDIESLDTEYINAVKSGDMKKAQQMVNAAAAIAGYNSSSSYQGTSAFNGAAPYGNGYFNSPEERKKAWDADPEHLEYEGDQTLGDYIKNGIDVNSLSFIALDPRNLRAADNYRREAIENIRQAIQSKSDTITMYRSVPSDVKEGSFRNGDWVTPSYSYAVDNASVHGWGDNYRIIEQKVSVDEIWWDGNDIAEWGYGNEQDYVQDKDYAYKNTKNNRKSLDAVTYDNDGNIIPLSKRFNDALADVRYQRSGQTVSPAKMEAELRDTLIGKLRSAGIDVITDVDEGQRVLDSFNKDARHQAVYNGNDSVKTGYNPRNYITPVRGEWTKEKIIKRLKESGGSLAGYSRAAELISEFDSPKELSEHMFYHGTYYGRGRLKPSMIMSDREVERIGGGGYGDKYWGISVSKSKEIASRFSGIHEGVFIYPIVLAKNANVKEMPDLNDAADLDDCIIDLWKEGIDAVWIGDKNRGEQELCVINPKAIVNIDSSDYYKAFMLGSEKNPLRIIDKAGIEKLYADAKTFVKQKQVAPRKPSSPSHFVFDDLEVAKSGYHVKEAAIELRRQAQVCKDGLTTSDKITLKQMTIMEESLKNNSDNQIYWKLAGEVEARNTSKRVGMTPLQRRNTLASETEDVDRKEQIVIKESPQRNYVTLSSPSTGRWHTADNEQREACEGYAELISKAIKCNLVWNDDSIGKAYNLNGQPFDIGDSYILSLHCNKNGYNTPIFATEQEVRQLNIGVWEKTMPFSLIKNGEVKKLYNIEDLSSFPQRFEIIKQIEDRETMKKAKANALSVFPTWKYPELDMTVKKDVQLDYNERRDLAKNLLDYSRGKMPDSYEAKSKETLVRCVAMGMLGNLYEFQYSEKVPGSNGLIARLERDPAFSKEILDKASASVAKVSTFVEENVRSFGEDKKLDLRSLTPIDMDVDGNGIVESQENLAADKKQGEDEPASQSQDTSHKHKGRVV